MNHQPIVFIDIETTGGTAKNSRIIDIGAIRIENGRIVKTMNQLINPDRPISYFITKLTGITNDMVWVSPRFASIAPGLEELLDGAIIAAHHVDFDYTFIKAEFRKIGVNFNHDRLCTVKLSRLLHPEHRRHGLDMIIERMGLTVTNRHRGYDDAEVLYKFFLSEMKREQLGTVLALAKLLIRSRKTKPSKASGQLLLL